MKPDRTIKAILFDIGWTLIYPKPTRKEAAADYLLALGYTVSPKIFSLANQAAVDFYKKRRWQPETVQNLANFWHEYYSIFVHNLGLLDPSLPKAFNEHVKGRIQYYLYPETRLVLGELRERGYLIGAVSNWSVELPDVLERLELAKYFDTLIVSDLVGYHKPQAEIFNLALSSLGAPPEATIHIGDDLAADVEGARRAGIRPVWLDRGEGGDRNPLSRIRSLEELLDMSPSNLLLAGR